MLERGRTAFHCAPSRGPNPSLSGLFQEMDKALLFADLGQEAGLINFAEVPLDDSAWKSTSLRERLRITSLKVLRDNAFLPVPAVISTYVPIGLIWWFGFQCLFMDTSVSLLTELNMKKLLIYQILHGLLGLGATSSLLGFRFKWHLGGTGIHFLMPGTLCSPLLPKLAQLLNLGQGAPRRMKPKGGEGRGGGGGGGRRGGSDSGARAALLAGRAQLRGLRRFASAGAAGGGAGTLGAAAHLPRDSAL